MRAQAADEECADLNDANSERESAMKRAMLLMTLLWLTVSPVTAQKAARPAPKHYKVNADEAPTNSVTADGSLRSPDGRLLAFPWVKWVTVDGLIEPRFELRIAGIDGAEPRVFYRDKDVLLLLVHQWSPDGKYVAATVFQKDRTCQLVLVSAAEGSVRILKTQALKTLNWSFQWHRMSFSPDGRFAVYDLSPQGGWHPRDIFAIPVDGGPEVPLVQHVANDLLLEWTPDGRGVLFASDRSGRWDLWVLPVFDGQPRDSPQLVKSNIENSIDWLRFTSLGFAPDGSYYYKIYVRQNDLYLATLDPKKKRFKSPTTLARNVGYLTSSEWSRDGQHLAYVLGRGSAYEPFILAIRSAGTGKERRLLLDTLMRHGGHGFEPKWSPDGRFILAVARERDYPGPGIDSQGLYRIDVQTGGVTPLVRTSGLCGGVCIESPAWSSDGRAIFKRRQTQSIVTRNLETGEEKELYRALPATVRNWPTSNLAVSPDGQRLAFVWTDEQAKTTALMVLPTAGGEPRELLRAQEPETVSVPAWTPDSRHIFYARSVSGENQKFALWRISAEGGESQNLELSMEARVPYGLSVHPDGKRIAFTAGTARREEVWVLKNFLPPLKSAK
jgi:Tol biopolymer transport system component